MGKKDSPLLPFYMKADIFVCTQQYTAVWVDSYHSLTAIRMEILWYVAAEVVWKVAAQNGRSSRLRQISESIRQMCLPHL